MDMKVDIVSKVRVKPSKYSSDINLKLSLLDQLAPSFYVPIVLFYSASDNANNVDFVDKLKASLSQTLTKFFPLAGRIYDDAHVQVRRNDGVSFSEARAHVDLNVVLKNPEVSIVEKLLPIDSYGGKPEDDDDGGDYGVPVLAVQSNIFACGGLALGICISHKIADGTTLSSFLAAWARVSADGHAGSVARPRLDAAELFPPREIHLRSPRNLMNRGAIATRRFVFSAASLASLKAEIAAASCTRVEAVTSLISKTATDSAPIRKSTNSAMAISHVVNLRPRMDPPLPENTLGNIWRCAVASVGGGGGASLGDVVAELRREIRRVDREYAAKLGSEEGFVGALWELKEVSELVSEGAIPFYKFSSWIRFPIYETDFGWGKPVWACVTTVPIEGAVILMSDRSGGGVEAWVNLEESHMACFQRNPQLLRFASQAPGS